MSPAAASASEPGELPVATWRPDAVAWSEARTAVPPLFVPPPKVRPALPWAAPSAVRRLHRRPWPSSRTAVRERLAFEVWRTTAATFGVRRLLGADGADHRWTALLPAPAALRPERPAITGVVLNRNSGGALVDAIATIQPVVDEVVVVDDGSTDGSPEEAEGRCGATIVRRALDGDFAAQRNAGIARAATPWVLMIDTDERLEPGAAPLLHRAVRHDLVDVVFLPRLNHVVERGDEPVSWPDFQGRLFRADLRFEGRLHEQLTGWRRPVHLPLSGPYLGHEKTLAQHYRSSLLYDALDPESPYPPELVAEMRRALAEAGEDEP